MPTHAAYRPKAIGFRDKFTPFLTCFAIFALGPLCYYLEQMAVPAKGHRITRQGHHVRTLDAATSAAAQKVWDFHLMHHTLKPADVIAVFCSHDLRVADHAVALYKDRRLSPRLLFSGGFGTGPHSGKNLNGWDRPEAEVFMDRAVALGVKREHIIVEDQARNTGENVVRTRDLLARRGVRPRRVIVVQKPFMERRTYATFRKRWPGVDLMISSPPISFAAYPTAQLDLDTIISIMVGDLQRLRLYATDRYPFQATRDPPSPELP